MTTLVGPDIPNCPKLFTDNKTLSTINAPMTCCRLTVLLVVNNMVVLSLIILIFLPSIPASLLFSAIVFLLLIILPDPSKHHAQQTCIRISNSIGMCFCSNPSEKSIRDNGFRKLKVFSGSAWYIDPAGAIVRSLPLVQIGR